MRGFVMTHGNLTSPLKPDIALLQEQQPDPQPAAVHGGLLASLKLGLGGGGKQNGEW